MPDESTESPAPESPAAGGPRVAILSQDQHTVRCAEFGRRRTDNIALGQGGSVKIVVYGDGSIAAVPDARTLWKAKNDPAKLDAKIGEEIQENFEKIHARKAQND